MSRETLVKERLGLLEKGFDRYLAAFDSNLPFSNHRQLEPHVRTIDRRRELASAATAIDDPLFISSLYETLRAWRLGMRGSRLADVDQFQAALKAHQGQIAALDGCSIDDAGLKVESCSREIWNLITDLEIVDNYTRLVPGTKALHHLLPDLVPPMDRQYTCAFFGWALPQTQYNQDRVFQEAFCSLALVARSVSPAKYVGRGWNTSRTKVLDNALIGFCRLDKAT